MGKTRQTFCTEIPRIVAGVPRAVHGRTFVAVGGTGALVLPRLRWIVIRRRFRQEVGRHEAALTAQLAQVEAVVVHVAVNVNDVACLERQLHLPEGMFQNH